MDASPMPIGATLVSARTADEYLAMFGLDMPALAGRDVLDCPGGAAAFVAAAARAGVQATAVDPVYAGDREELIAHARAEADRGNAYVRTNAHLFVWDHFRDPGDHDRRRREAVERFATDLRSAPHRYVAAGLPSLPFADHHFDLALCSHLLFTYDDRLDLTFHVSAIGELLRVANDVRIFPTLSMRFERSELVEPIIATFTAAGVEVETRRSSYQFQRGGDEVLALRHAGGPVAQ